jgi:hypothetical protein
MQKTLFDVDSLRTDSAREAAIKLIKDCVLRDDSIRDLKSSQQGRGIPNGMHASISGYVNGVKYSPEFIVVERDIHGKEVNQVFKLNDIYREIKSTL